MAHFNHSGDLPRGSGPIRVVDVDGDGKRDIVTANRVTNNFSVLIGNGSGNFQSQQRFVAGNSPRAVAVVDVNGDGKPDIITANSDSNSVSVIVHR